MALKPIHPGEYILYDCLEPLGVSISEAARHIGISRKHLSNICNKRSSVTPNIALRLSRAFGSTPSMWLKLQNKYDLALAEKEKGWKKIKPMEGSDAA